MYNFILFFKKKIRLWQAIIKGMVLSDSVPRHQVKIFGLNGNPNFYIY